MLIIGTEALMFVCGSVSVCVGWWDHAAVFYLLFLIVDKLSEAFIW